MNGISDNLKTPLSYKSCRNYVSSNLQVMSCPREENCEDHIAFELIKKPWDAVNSNSFNIHYKWAIEILEGAIYTESQDWVAIMSQPYWVEVEVCIEVIWNITISS